jgi:hypothetical protein
MKRHAVAYDVRGLCTARIYEYRELLGKSQPFARYSFNIVIQEPPPLIAIQVISSFQLGDPPKPATS